MSMMTFRLFLAGCDRSNLPRVNWYGTLSKKIYLSYAFMQCFANKLYIGEKNSFNEVFYQAVFLGVNFEGNYLGA